MSMPPAQELGAWTRFFREWHFADLLEKWAWRWRRVVWLSIVGFYLLCFNGLWRITLDSGLYLSIARSIARGEGYVYHGEPHRLVYPGLPYLLAGLMKLSEKHAIALADLLMLVSALLMLALCYRMFKLVVRPGAAVVATVFTAVNLVILDLTFSILTDMPFLLGTVMVLAGGALCDVLTAPRLDETAQPPSPRERKLGFVLLPAGLLLCAVMRPTFYTLAGCAILASLFSAMRLRRWRFLLIAVALTAFIGLIYLVVSHADPRRSQAAQDIYEEAVSWQIQHAYSDPGILARNAWAIVSPELPVAFFAFNWGDYGNPIPVALLAVAVFWILRRWPMAILWICATIATHFVVEPKPRYMAVIVPFLGIAWWEAAVRVERKIHWRLANTLTITVFCLMIPNAVRDVAVVWRENYARPFMTHYREGAYEAVWEAAEIVRREVPEDAVVIVPEKTSSVFTYLSDRIAIETSEPRMERFRDRPVWVVVTRLGTMRNSLQGRGFQLIHHGTATHADYGKQSVLVVRKARWPEKDRF